MSEIKVTLKKTIDHSYKIFVKKDCSEVIASYLKKSKLGNKYAIITDTKVNKLYGLSLARFLAKKGIKAEIFSIKPGEKSKNLLSIEEISNEMIKKGIDRRDAIIALGGGVVGDFAGFISSVYMRGIPYIQIPTTLLAMVDSSIGGKTGVDLKSGKNLVGTMNQPKAVFTDIAYLKNLPLTQIRSGLAEIIKYGVIKDASLFKFIEDNLEKILKIDEKAINHIVTKSIKIKSEIVQKDEHENGIRMTLNYGHTYGHAIEKMSGYKLLHGYAISIGMVLANDMAINRGILGQKDAERIRKLIKKAGLPTSTMKKPSKSDLLSDKKKEGDYINFILATKIGKVVIQKEKCQ